MRLVARFLAPAILLQQVACQSSLVAIIPARDGCRTMGVAAAPSTRPAGTLSARAGTVTGRPFGIRVSSGGQVFVTQQDANSVARLSLATLSAAAPVTVGNDPGDVVFNRGGTTAYVSNFNDGSVQVIDVGTGAHVRLLLVAPTNAYRLALSPDEMHLYVTSVDGSIYSVDLSGKDAPIPLHLGGALNGLAITRDGGTLFVSSTHGGVWRVNACTMAIEQATTLASAGVQEVVVSPDEAELYVANESGWVDVLSSNTLSLARHIAFAGLRPFGIAVTGDGARLYVASASTGQVAIADPRSNTVHQVFNVGGTPRRIAFDASGATAVVSNEGNWVDVIR